MQPFRFMKKLPGLALLASDSNLPHMVSGAVSREKPMILVDATPKGIEPTKYPKYSRWARELAQLKRERKATLKQQQRERSLAGTRQEQS